MQFPTETERPDLPDDFPQELRLRSFVQHFGLGPEPVRQIVPMLVAAGQEELIGAGGDFLVDMVDARDAPSGLEKGMGLLRLLRAAGLSDVLVFRGGPCLGMLLSPPSCRLSVCTVVGQWPTPAESRAGS